jgi:hypothetical protein
MASPDITPYVDLTLYDVEPIDVYEESIEYARVALPEWNPATGSVEDAIIQATAQMTAELVGAINRIPSGIFEALLQLFDIERLSGTRATASVTITTIDDLGYTIPAGTQFGYLDTADPDNTVLYSFTTDVELVIPAASSTGIVAITGTKAVEYPELSAGTALRLLTPISTIDSVELFDDLDIGEDQETDEQFFTRASAKLNSYTAALVLTEQYSQYILTTYPEVHRCKTYSRLNPVNNDWDDALEDGYVTIYACAASGASLTAGSASVILEDVVNRSVAGLSISIEPTTIVPIDVDVTITLLPGYLQSDITTSVETALNQYLHPDYWDWSDTMYYNEVIALVSNVAGVDRVVDLTLADPGTGTQIVDTVNLQFLKYGALPLVTPTVTVQT